MALHYDQQLLDSTEARAAQERVWERVHSAGILRRRIPLLPQLPARDGAARKSRAT